MANDHYRQFIDEAYIGPIRSVLIVDDDYPTVDEILGSQPHLPDADNVHGEKRWRQRPDRMARMIRAFRQGPTPLLVDIHDGTDISRDTEMATHLHQCDLLVLDYQLERAKPRDGTRSMAILRAVMANSHFNLVVIYTDEVLDFVFDAVRWALVAPSSETLSASESRDAQSLIAAAEDEVDDLNSKLLATIDAEQYFHSRLTPKYLRMMMKGEEPYGRFVAETGSFDWSPEEKKVVLRYLLDNVERANDVGTDSDNRFRDLMWSPRAPIWITSGNSFVTFAKKTNDDNLLSVLREALHDWNPQPSRLVLAKIRAAIDEYGVSAQGAALRDRHALAYWYHGLLATDSEEDRRWRIAESVSRHAGKLGKEILPNVEEFVSALIDAERGAGHATTICRNHFDVNLDDDYDKRQAALEHNAFVCSTEPTGWHLTAGHVFHMVGDYWLCASPSCDMVPSQISSWQTATFGERLPFIGVRLEEFDPSRALDGISSNRFFFLRRNGEYRGYRFNYPHENSAPRWQVLYADDRGQFSGPDLAFTVSCIQQEESTLVGKPQEAKVVGQLRYEYALNLIQKLGVSLTRIGLEFTDGTRS